MTQQNRCRDCGCNGELYWGLCWACTMEKPQCNDTNCPEVIKHVGQSKQPSNTSRLTKLALRIGHGNYDEMGMFVIGLRVGIALSSIRQGAAEDLMAELKDVTINAPINHGPITLETMSNLELSIIREIFNVTHVNHIPAQISLQ